EPTRGVDVGDKAEIHSLIQRLTGEGRDVVLISSDLPEVMAQSDRVGVFREGRLVAVHDPRATDAETVATLALPVHGREGEQDLSPTRQRGRWLPLLARRAQVVSGAATRS